MAIRAIIIRLLLSLALSFPLFSAFAAQPEINVEMDRDQVRLNESFQIIFSVSEEPDETPDFSPLEENFDILNRMQSSQVSIINSNYQKTIQWKLTLIPKKSGEIEIPAIQFGDAQSKPQKISILEEDANADNQSDLFIEAEVTPKTAYVQSQLIYTIRVLSRYNMASGSLSEPSLENALVTRLGNDRNYTTSRNGKGYQVIERRYAIFPQSSGVLTIAPLQLDAEIMTSTNSQSRFGRFSSQMKRLSTPEFSVNVEPTPTNFTGKHWLPAEQFSIEQRWSADFNQIKTGDPITRTIVMRGKGVPSSQLPEVDMGQAVDSNGLVNETAIKFYSDQPSKNETQSSGGITSHREEKFALIATKPGEYTLPAVEIPWWNTNTNQMEIARLPETNITVIAAPADTGSPGSTTQNNEQQDSLDSSQNVETITTQTISGSAGYWPWISLALGLGWIITAMAWWRNRYKSPSSDSSNKASIADSGSFSRKELQAACQTNDGHKARASLLSWAQAYWPELKIRSLSEIKNYCGLELAKEIDRLNRSLYAANSNRWEAGELWGVFVAEEKSKRTIKKPNSDQSLSPLYR